MNLEWLTVSHAFEILFLVGFLTVAYRFLGEYLYYVYMGKKNILTPICTPIEQGFYRLMAISSQKDMNWREYAGAVLVFGVINFIFLYILLCGQAYLPFGDGKSISPDMAFHMAISFITNTNFQTYIPEKTVSLFTQMFGLTVQNFVSAGVGMAVLLAFVRGFLVKNNEKGLGNFWVDCTRTVLYVLLPIAFISSILLVSQGVVQNFEPSLHVSVLEQPNATGQIQQEIASGAVASQTVIKQLGTNGGGFYNANSAHPFENPTGLSNFLQMFLMLLLPISSLYMVGRMFGNVKQLNVILGVMGAIFVPLWLVAVSLEQAGWHGFGAIGVAQVADSWQSGGLMEGKEARFGVSLSVLWSVITTATSSGGVNAAISSLMPLVGMIPLLLIQMGELVFGGVGSGLYNMFIMVILTVFIAGLMVGRSPELLGKKISPFDMKLVSFLILMPCVLILGMTAITMMLPASYLGTFHLNAHGLTEILYAFSSSVNNNGSGFAGMTTSSPYYHITLGVCMFIGRYGAILAVLALAGSFASKNIVPNSAGTLPTNTVLFGSILIGIILLVSVLTFMPALALGPISEHLNMIKG